MSLNLYYAFAEGEGGSMLARALTNAGEAVEKSTNRSTVYPVLANITVLTRTGDQYISMQRWIAGEAPNIKTATSTGMTREDALAARLRSVLALLVACLIITVLHTTQGGCEAYES